MFCGSSSLSPTARRRIRGYSWTGDIEMAWWFADRGVLFGAGNPAVFEAEIPEELVLFYDNGRNEHEYVCLLPAGYPVGRIKRVEKQAAPAPSAMPST
jgi:hypothetical protein